jgi:deoxyguanosine kinase
MITSCTALSRRPPQYRIAAEPESMVGATVNRYLVIEGPIGVGKSSLSRLLSNRLQARLVLEKVEENPFLPRFYENPKRFAFQAQVFFLLSRYRQQVELGQMDLFSQMTICDYFLPKDQIFASVTLSDEERALYDQLYQLLSPRVATPDLLIYLQASTDTLIERIETRGRPFEKEIPWDYLDTINNAYNKFFFHYEQSPLLVVQTEAIDFVNDPDDLEDLIKQIASVKQGTHYYVPRK